MSVWKDLLFLGGHVATPAALEALRDGPADLSPSAIPAAPSPPAPDRHSAGRAARPAPVAR